MSQHYSNTVNTLVQFIHNNIDKPITLAQLSDYTDVSKFHLNRIFFAYTGIQLGEYVQRRKMEHAFEQLQQPNANVLDIALDVGYESHSSFTLAFTKLFGFSPKQVKDSTAPVSGLPKTKKPILDETLNPIITSLEEQEFFGFYGKGFKDQSYIEVANRLYTKLAQTLNVTGYDYSSDSVIGVSLASPWRGDQAEAVFFAGIDSREVDNSKELETYTRPKATWAVFTHHGPYDTMWRTILKAYSGWVIPHNYQLLDSAVIQRYRNNPKTTPQAELSTEIYIPFIK